MDSLDFLEPFSGKASTQMNLDLMKEFNADEVNKVLNQMNPTKTMGPNGMSPIFFQKYWHVVGNTITSVLLQALNLGSFPSMLNHTHITLIPKKKCFVKMGDYRSISLCNVAYKPIAKVLSNRLKAVLPSVIK